MHSEALIIIVIMVVSTRALQISIAGRDNDNILMCWSTREEYTQSKRGSILFECPTDLERFVKKEQKTRKECEMVYVDGNDEQVCKERIAPVTYRDVRSIIEHVAGGAYRQVEAWEDPTRHLLSQLSIYGVEMPDRIVSLGDTVSLAWKYAQLVVVIHDDSDIYYGDFGEFTNLRRTREEIRKDTTGRKLMFVDGTRAPQQMHHETKLCGIVHYIVNRFKDIDLPRSLFCG